MGSLAPTLIPGGVGSLVSTGVNYQALRDREALVALYNGTGGANWRSNTNWLTEWPVGQWHGVTTDRAGRVTRLSLEENNLAGALPPEFGNLGSLEQVFLDANELTGAIPPELGRLARLDWLGLSGNKLSGAIPPELGNLAGLEGLGLGGNNLTGTIPPELGKLGSLQDLWLGENNLTGAIPPELGNLGRLAWLGLGDNNLTGAVPVELGNLHNLETLSLENNKLTGPLPLSLAGLERLDGLSYFNTGLCVPDDESLCAWLESLRVHRGTGVRCTHRAPGREGRERHPSEMRGTPGRDPGPGHRVRYVQGRGGGARSGSRASGQRGRVGFGEGGPGRARGALQRHGRPELESKRQLAHRSACERLVRGGHRQRGPRPLADTLGQRLEGSRSLRNSAT